MIAQLDATVARPEIAWDGLLPILTLGVGALLLVLFRSLMKQLPKAAADQAVPVIGGLTVIAMWVVGGFAGTDVPLAGLRDDLGDPLFFLGLLIVIGLAGWFAQYLRLSVDAALTVMIGLTSLATTWGVWTDRYEVDGAFGLVGDQLGADGFSLVITGVIAGAIVLVALLLDDYLEREGMAGAEMYVLMLFSGAGGAVMASANDLIVLFLALETLSIAVYVMAAMHMRRSESQEAGLKYFVLGAFSSAFLLYGIALTYGAVGSTNLIVIADFLEQNRLIEDGLLMAGMAMLLVGLGFKVAAAPFHAWTPDVYQGAPTPVVAFMASAVKAAGFAALVRVFVTTFADHADDWQPAVYGLAILTLVVGSFMAIVQRDAKRMLAYSSISHAGFILVGVQAASDEGISSVLFYAVAYTFLVIGSFGVLSIVSGEGDRGTSLDHLDGLSTRRPALALALTVFLLAQAGVPLTSGFVAKFAVIGAAVEARSYWLAIAAMVTAVVSAFLYLRIILSMYLGQAEDDAPTIRVPRAAGLAIIVALVITVGFGLVPGELDDITRDAVPVLIAAGWRRPDERRHRVLGASGQLGRGARGPYRRSSRLRSAADARPPVGFHRRTLGGVQRRSGRAHPQCVAHHRTHGDRGGRARRHDTAGRSGAVAAHGDGRDRVGRHLAGRCCDCARPLARLGYGGARTPRTDLRSLAPGPVAGRHRSLAGVEGCSVQRLMTTVAESARYSAKIRRNLAGEIVLDPFESGGSQVASLGLGTCGSRLCSARNPNSRVTPRVGFSS